MQYISSVKERGDATEKRGGGGGGGGHKEIALFSKLSFIIIIHVEIFHVDVNVFNLQNRYNFVHVQKT